jgi:hypothetical protein
MGAGSVSATCQNAAPVTGDINSDKVNGERLGRHLGSTARVDSRLGGRPRSEPKRPGRDPSESCGDEVEPNEGALGLGLNQRPSGTGPTVKNHWGIVNGLGVEP